MSIELVMCKRTIDGDKMPNEKISIQAIDGQDISDFWDKHKRGPQKPKEKKTKQHN